MTTWLEGDKFPYPHSRRFCLEIGENQVWGYVRDSNAYYTVRYWEGGITKWTPETFVAFVGVENETCQVRLSPKDDYLQYSVGTRNFYIRQQDFDEIKPPAPPPPPPAPDPIQDIHGHWLSWFEWYLWKAWDPAAQPEIDAQARETLREARQNRVGLVDTFLFVSNGAHPHVDTKTPWVYRDDKFDLKAPNARFWQLAASFLQLHKDEGVDLVWKLFMGFGYNILPFRQNHQGVNASEVWDPVVWPYARALALKVGHLYNAVYGPNYKPFISPNNEFAHWDGESFHDIAYFHKDIIENAYDAFTVRKNMIVDISHCEGARMCVVERHGCPKPGVWCDGWHGMGDGAVPIRDVIPEDHGMSTLEDFIATPAEGEAKLWTVLGSANHIWRPTGDGGSWTGSGQGASFGGYRVGTPAQYLEMGRVIWPEARKAGKRILYGWFPIETLKSNGLPDYRKSEIIWECAASLRLAWEEAYE